MFTIFDITTIIICVIIIIIFLFKIVFTSNSQN